MLRYSLAIYLLLINLTGPSPCCCTMARFVATVTSGVLPASSCRPVAFSCCSGTLTLPAPASTGPTGESHRSTGPGAPERKCQCECLVSVEAGAPVTIMADQSRVWLDDLAGMTGVPARFDVLVNSLGRDHRSTVQPTAVLSGRDTRVAMSSLLC